MLQIGGSSAKKIYSNIEKTWRIVEKNPFRRIFETIFSQKSFSEFSRVLV